MASPKSQKVLGNVVEKGGTSLELTESLYFIYFISFYSHGKISFLLEAKSNLNDDDDEYNGKRVHHKIVERENSIVSFCLRDCHHQPLLRYL